MVNRKSVNDNKIIIIRGNSGSGKTTVAKELCKQLGKDCMLLSQDVIKNCRTKRNLMGKFQAKNLFREMKYLHRGRHGQDEMYYEEYKDVFKKIVK